MMHGLGQMMPCESAGPDFMKSGPFDLSCAQKHPDGSTVECAQCLNQQNILNAAVALDEPYMWTHRIVPALVVGAIVGVLIGKAIG